MELREYPNIGEQAYYDTLSNGLRLIMVKKSDYKKSMAFFAANYGGADRRFRLNGEWYDTPAGVAHFLEHKMFDMEDGQNALTLLSGKGADANAFTSSDMTAYHFESIDDFYGNLELLLKFVSIPYFTDESVRKEQGIIGQEIRMTEDEPDYAMYYGLLRELYKNNPVRESVAGTVESISDITAKTLYDCHKVFYNPSNMVLTVVGDQDPEKVREMAENILPKNPGPVPIIDHGEDDGPKPCGKRTERVMEVGSTMFLSGLKLGTGLTGRDAVKFELTAGLALSTLMGSASPLYSRMYAEGLVNDTFSYEVESTAGVTFAAFGGECQNPDEVFETVMKEAKSFSKGGFDREFFKRRKKAFYGRALRALNSFDSICYNVSSASFRGYDFFRTIDMVDSITEDDVMSFAAKYLRPEKSAISIIYRQEK